MGPDKVHLRWSHGTASISTLAGMLLDAEFAVVGGTFSPFAQAPWLGQRDGDPSLSALPGHRRTLAGEFVCVPFGAGSVPADAAHDWQPFRSAVENEPPHGRSADDRWQVVATSVDSVTLRLDYPDASPVLALERTISGVDGESALDFRLVITARSQAAIAVGVHPIFRLPDSVGRLTVRAEFEQGYAYPGTLPQGRQAVLPGSRFSDIHDATGTSGAVDVGRLPLEQPTEDVIQLTSVTAPIRLHYLDENVTVELDWDRSTLPSVLLWISDRGVDDHPWNGNYRGLGVEPIAAAFDFPNSVSTGSNPLRDRGISTSVDLDPAKPLTIDYRVSVRAEN